MKSYLTYILLHTVFIFVFINSSVSFNNHLLRKSFQPLHLRLPSTLFFSSKKKRKKKDIVAEEIGIREKSDFLKEAFFRLDLELEDANKNANNVEKLKVNVKDVDQFEVIGEKDEEEKSSNSDLVIKLLKEFEKGKEKLMSQLLSYVDQLQQANEREKKLQSIVKGLDVELNLKNQSLANATNEIHKLNSQRETLEEEINEVKSEFSDRVDELVDTLEYDQMERMKVEIKYKQAKENEKRLEASVTALDRVLFEANKSLANATDEIENLTTERTNLQNDMKKLSSNHKNELNVLADTIENERKKVISTKAQLEHMKSDMAQKLTQKKNEFFQYKAKSLSEKEQMVREKDNDIAERDSLIEKYEEERSSFRKLARQSVNLTKNRIVKLYRRLRKKKN